jgi:hypothetical protein
MPALRRSPKLESSLRRPRDDRPRFPTELPCPVSHARLDFYGTASARHPP